MPKQESQHSSSHILIPVEAIADKIYLIRSQKVMFDADLAKLYGVSTRRLNEQIRRNRDRFPEDFAFVLTSEEFANLMSHFATSSLGWGGRRKLPYAFTEHGAIMAANVLSSPIAVGASIQVVRAFVGLRELLTTHKDLARKLEDLEQKYAAHDVRIQQIFSYIKQLMNPRASRHPQIGFIPSKERK
jgi:ABC-type multidrug transport system ATPase subunit